MTLVTLNSTGHDQLLYEVSLKKICRYLYKLYMVNISVNCPNYMVNTCIAQISTVLVRTVHFKYSVHNHYYG